MSYVELQSKEVITHKDHRCGWCNELIEAGSLSHYRAYIFDSDFQSEWMHKECHEAMLNIGQDAEDGWLPGDFARGSTLSRT